MRTAAVPVCASIVDLRMSSEDGLFGCMVRKLAPPHPVFCPHLCTENMPFEKLSSDSGEISSKFVSFKDLPSGVSLHGSGASISPRRIIVAVRDRARLTTCSSKLVLEQAKVTPKPVDSASYKVAQSIRHALATVLLKLT